MNKAYNTKEKTFNPNIRKIQLKIIPYISLGIILSEASMSNDIAK